MKFSQIKIAAILMTLLTHIIAGDAYNYVDIGECILPIDKRLKQIEFGNYTKIEDGSWKSKYPTSIAIDEKKTFTKKSYKKVVSMLKLKHKIFIAGFEGLEGKGLNNNNILIRLKDHMILFTNYASNDLEYILEYCKRTSKQ